MKQSIIILLLLSLIPLSVMADEYIDPNTHVVYRYNPQGSTAQVKPGNRIDTDISGSYYDPGSPNATGEIIVLERFSINGKEYVVNSIGDWAFSTCGITSVTIPSTVEKIGMEAFCYCTSLSTVRLTKGLKEIGYAAFYGCKSIPSIMLPDGLETIDFEAFFWCDALTSITIPASVTSIKDCSFWCSGLKSVTSLIEEPFPVRDICDFRYYHPVLYVPAGTKEKYASLAGWNDFPHIYELNRSWYYEGSKMMRKDGIYGPHIQYADYEQKGDTIINGNKYVKVYRTNPETKSTSYFGAYREEGEQVLRILSGDTDESVLFDFGMNIGDELPSQSGVFLSSVDKVKTVHDGVENVLLRQKFAREDGTFVGCYVERIGGINGWLDGSFEGSYDGSEDYRESLDRFVVDDHTIYDSSVDIDIFLDAEKSYEAWQYHPFAKEGKVFLSASRKYEMKGDTVIFKDSYKKVYVTENDDTRYWGAVRDNRTMVVAIKADSPTREVLYAFGYDNPYTLEYGYGKEEAHVGQPFISTTKSGEKWKLSYVCPFDKYSDIQRSSSYLWIDGIGNISDPFEPLGGSENYECYEDGVCIFNIDILMELMTNKETAISEIKKSAPKTDNTLFDLQGRRISGKPAKGMYIQNGKKYVK
jgi:hypothetical protein